MNSRHSPIRATDLFSIAAIECGESVAWGKRIPCPKPGVYVIEFNEVMQRAPIDPERVRAWLGRVPDLRLDGQDSDPEALIARLERFWWPKSQVIYIGCTTRRLSRRLAVFVRHVLGDSSPHCGGQWLKALTRLDALRVWWAPCVDPHAAEGRLLLAFRGELRACDDRLALRADHELLPFANLKTENGVRKLHGFSRQSR